MRELEANILYMYVFPTVVLDIVAVFSLLNRAIIIQ
jgi:hypothetical protein